MAEDTRPNCKCHGEPMHRNGPTDFRCSVKKRARERARHWNEGGRERRIARYDALKAQGLCTRCKQPALTSSVCWDCLNDQEARDAISLGSR